MHQSCAISCAERGMTGEVEVQSGADEELSPTHTHRPPKVATESNTSMKTESTKDGHNRLKKPQESMSSGEPT
jgi:hypothetical protein